MVTHILLSEKQLRVIPREEMLTFQFIYFSSPFLVSLCLTVNFSSLAFLSLPFLLVIYVYASTILSLHKK